MRVVGMRTDGALSILTVGKVIVLKGDFMSPPSEERDVLALGGWQAPTSVSEETRLAIQKMLDRARVRPLPSFRLADWDESSHPRGADGKFEGDGAASGGSGSGGNDGGGAQVRDSLPSEHPLKAEHPAGTGKFSEPHGEKGAIGGDRTQTMHWDTKAAGGFAQKYDAAKAGGYRKGGPTTGDEKAAERFHEQYQSKETRSGFAGGGTTLYTHKETGSRFEVDRNPNGKTFYGTHHGIREVK